MCVSVLVAHRVTEIYSSSFVRALNRAIESRSLDVCVMRVQVNKEYVRYSVGLLNDAIKIKGTEESRSLPYRFDKN